MRYLHRLGPVSRVLVAAMIAASSLLATTVTSEASGGYRYIWVPLYRQIHGLDCEAAALQMALAHERIYVGQNRILNAMAIDWRQPVVDSTGFHWGDPYTNFVGNPDGSELRQTGYGAYSPIVEQVAREFGGRIVGSGQGFTPAMIYQALLRGHPVVAWVSFDWRRHYPSSYQAFDGNVVPYGSPYEHAVTLYGVTPGYVMVNNPWHGYRQWISKARFQAAFATFGNMAIILA